MATITSLGFNITSEWNGDGVARARSDIQALEVEMRRVSGAALNIDVVVDSAKARAELESLRDEKVNVVIEFAINGASEIQAQAKIAEVTRDRSVGIGFEIDQSSYAAMEAQLEVISSLIDDVSIGFNISEASYRAAEARIALLTRDRIVNVHVDADSDSIVRMTNNFRQMEGASEQATNHMSRGMRLARLAALAFLASLGVIPAAVTAIGTALLTIPGIAGVALGGALLSRVESVRNAFSDLGDHILAIGDRAVVPMIQPVLENVAKVKTAISDMEPVFKTTFENSARLVTPLTDTLIAFVQRIMPGFNDAIGNAVPLLNGLQEGVKNFATSLSRMFSAMSKEAEGFGMTWNLWFTYLGRIMEAFGYSAARMVNDVNETFGDSLRSFEHFIRGFLDGLEGMQAALAKANGGLNFFWTLGDMLRIILPAFGNFYAAFSQAFGPAIQSAGIGIANLAASLLNSLGQAINVASPYIQRFAFYLGQGFEAMSKINGVLPGLAIGIGILLKVIMANPFVALAGAVITLIGYLWDLEKRTGAVSEAIKKAWAVVGPAVMPVVNTVRDGFNSLKDAMNNAGGVSGVWDKITNALKPVGDVIGKLVDTYMPQIRRIGETFMEAFRPIWQDIKPKLEELWVSLQGLWDRMQPVLQIIGAVIGAAIGGILGMIEHGIKPAKEIIVTVFNAIVGAISNIIDFITAAIRTVTGVVQIVIGIVKGVAAAFTGNGEAFKNAMKGISDGVKNVFGGIGNMFMSIVGILKNVWDLIVGLFKNGIGLVIGVVRGFIDGVINFFKHMWDVLVGHSIVPDMINAVIQWFKELPGKVLGLVIGWVGDIIGWFASLPGKVYDALAAFGQRIMDAFQNGVNLVKGLWDGFWNYLRAAYDAWANLIRGAWDAIWNWLVERWNNFKNNIQAAWDAVWNYLTNAWNAWSNMIRGAWDAIWNWLKERWENFKTNIQNAWDAMWRFLTEKWESFKSFISNAWQDFWDRIGNAAKAVWDWIVDQFDKFKQKVIDVVQNIIDKVKEIWNNITGIFQGPIDTVKGIWNGVAGAFGLPHLAMGGPVVEGMATGGSVRGKGTGTSDDIPTMLSNGEHVWTAKEVELAGGHAAMFQMRNAVAAGNKIGIGDPNKDNVMLAEGGAVRPPTLDPAIRMAREKGDGRAYVYGGSGPDGFDCSGYMSAIFNALTNRPLWGRSFSTESDFDGLGFQKGLGAGFSIGVMRGGGGPNSHMAGTLDGVNVESGGGHNSTRYGGPAAGADHGQFPLKWHLPIMDGQFVSGGMGSGGSGPTAEQIAQINKAKDEIKAVMRDSQRKALYAINDAQMRYAKNPGAAGYVGQIPQLSDDYASNADKISSLGVADSLPPAGVVKDGVAAMAKLDAALASMSNAGPIGGTIPDGDRLRIIEEAMRITSTPPPDTREQWLAGMNTLIQRESGWNAGARNDWDSNAAAGNASVGLAQVIPTTFEANKAPGHNNIYDPVDNVAASINYIKRRYGSITAVQQANANMPPKGYAAGTNSAAAGWNLVGETGPEMVKFNGGEKVRTFDEIISTLKASAAGEGKALMSKVSADFDRFTQRLAEEVKAGNQDMSGVFREELRQLVERVVKSGNESGNKLAVTIEDAIERVLREAGVNINLPLQLPTNGDPNQFVNEVVRQIESAVRQGVGAHA